MIIPTPYLVSILVPIYNVEGYMRRCANSLFRQTYTNIEFVFINDCTKDKSVEQLLEVCKQFPARNQQIRIINNIQNLGIAQTRNLLVEYASGDFILYVDSDDWITDETVENLVNKQIESNADITMADFFIFSEDTKTITPWGENKYSNAKEMLKEVTARLDHFPLWGRLIRRTLFLKHNIRMKEGLNYGEDLQIVVMLLFYADKLAYASEARYYYNTGRKDSLMHLDPQKMLIQGHVMLQSTEIVWRFLQNHNYCFMEQVNNCFVSRIYSYMDTAVQLANNVFFKRYKVFLSLFSQSTRIHQCGDNVCVYLLKNNYLTYRYVYYLFKRILVRIKL